MILRKILDGMTACGVILSCCNANSVKQVKFIPIEFTTKSTQQKWIDVDKNYTSEETKGVGMIMKKKDLNSKKYDIQKDDITESRTKKTDEITLKQAKKSIANIEQVCDAVAKCLKDGEDISSLSSIWENDDSSTKNEKQRLAVSLLRQIRWQAVPNMMQDCEKITNKIGLGGKYPESENEFDKALEALDCCLSPECTDAIKYFSSDQLVNYGLVLCFLTTMKETLKKEPVTGLSFSSIERHIRSVTEYIRCCYKNYDKELLLAYQDLDSKYIMQAELDDLD